MSIRVEHDLGRIEKFAKRAGTELPAALARGALTIATHAAGELAEQVKTKLAKRPTGSLMRSFEARLISVGKDVVAAEATSRRVYARIHDEGGIIRPRSGKMLAIPHRLANIPRGKWPRHFAKGKLIRIGKLLVQPIVKAAGKGRSGPAELRGYKPMFILVPSVRIKPTGYIAAARNELMKDIDKLVTPEIAHALNIASTVANSGGRNA